VDLIPVTQHLFPYTTLFRSCTLRAASPGRVSRRDSTKCWPHTRIELVSSPSVNTWTIPHVDAGTHRWTTPSTTSATIHSCTGRVARRRHDPRRPAGLRGAASVMPAVEAGPE